MMIELEEDEFCSAARKEEESVMCDSDSVDYYIVESETESLEDHRRVYINQPEEARRVVVTDDNISLSSISDDEFAYSLSSRAEDEVAYTLEGNRTVTEVNRVVYSDISSDEEDIVVTVLNNKEKEDDSSSSSSDEEDVVVAVVSEEEKEDEPSGKCSPLFACDGVIELLGDDDVVKISVNGNVSEVIKVIKEGYSLHRDIWLSVGNREASLDYVSSSFIVDKNKWNNIIRETIGKVMLEISNFNKQVLAAGGKCIAISLIPNPAVVDPKVSVFSENFQKLASRVFVSLNKKIDQFNVANRITTVHINRYLEVKRAKTSGRSSRARQVKILQHKTTDYYPGRDQRKIKLENYSEDWIHLKMSALQKISQVFSKAIRNQQQK